MMKNVRKLACNILMALASVFITAFPAYAAVDNPPMGDLQGRYVSVVIAVMAAALLVIVVVAIISSKKKKK